MIYILLFILGTIFYSFSYCVSYRIIHHLNFVSDHSRCEYCDHILNWYDLIPIISYICLKGNCRYCDHPILRNHLYIEILGGFITLILYIKYNLLCFIIYEIVGMILFICAYIDYKELVIYDVFQYILMVLGIIKCIVFYNNMKWIVIYILIICVPLLLLALLKKQSIGMGDIYLYASLCLILNNQIILCFIISIYSSLIVCLYLLLTKRLSLSDPIPFIPFIYIGYLVCLMI